MLRGVDQTASDNSASTIPLEWTDTGVKIWTQYNNADWMNNENGVTYFYVAVGYALQE